MKNIYKKYLIITLVLTALSIIMFSIGAIFKISLLALYTKIFKIIFVITISFIVIGLCIFAYNTIKEEFE